MNSIISIENLKKSFGEIKAVDNISFNVNKGELFAFLGVNGAGKSTTINILCGQLSKDEGKVIIDGISLDEDKSSLKRKIGVVFQESVLDGPLSVLDNLKSRGALYGLNGKALYERINELADLLNLNDLLKRQVNKLSGGQKRRVDIARALIHKPEIIILDEPTTGLDPQTRKNIWNVINNLRKTEGITVFLTTHYMEEATDANYIVILDNGKIATEGTPVDLKNKYTRDSVILYGADENEVKKMGVEYIIQHNSIRFYVENTAKATDLIIKYPHIFKDYEITKGKMDDVFLSATGKALNNENQ
jgi:multidrug/hemolysin transport system ATP-binding protein